MVGFVVHLNYDNPHLSPYDEFQRFKTHPAIRTFFEGGKALSMAARAINEGGLQVHPPAASALGGALIVAARPEPVIAVPHHRQPHNAMKTGMLAADAASRRAAERQSSDVLDDYPRAGAIPRCNDDLFTATSSRR